MNGKTGGSGQWRRKKSIQGGLGAGLSISHLVLSLHPPKNGTFLYVAGGQVCPYVTFSSFTLHAFLGESTQSHSHTIENKITSFLPELHYYASMHDDLIYLVT